MTQTRNSVALNSFIRYCKNHPDERFWQALRNWSKYDLIYAVKRTGAFGLGGKYFDTFNWEGVHRYDPDKDCSLPDLFE